MDIYCAIIASEAHTGHEYDDPAGSSQPPLLELVWQKLNRAIQAERVKSSSPIKKEDLIPWFDERSNWFAMIDRRCAFNRVLCTHN